MRRYSGHEQADILKDQLREANATIEFVREELWGRALDLWEARDCLYYAIVLLASCDACKNESLSWLKARIQESERVCELLEALKGKDIRNSKLLEDAGVDLASWKPAKEAEHEQPRKGGGNE